MPAVARFVQSTARPACSCRGLKSLMISGSIAFYEDAIQQCLGIPAVWHSQAYPGPSAMRLESRVLIIHRTFVTGR